MGCLLGSERIIGFRVQGLGCLPKAPTRIGKIIAQTTKSSQKDNHSTWLDGFGWLKFRICIRAKVGSFARFVGGSCASCGCFLLPYTSCIYWGLGICGLQGGF